LSTASALPTITASQEPTDETTSSQTEGIFSIFLGFIPYKYSIANSPGIIKYVFSSFPNT